MFIFLKHGYRVVSLSKFRSIIPLSQLDSHHFVELDANTLDLWTVAIHTIGVSIHDPQHGKYEYNMTLLILRQSICFYLGVGDRELFL